MPDESFNHTQAMQRATATIITCRTLIKYNLNLNSEQKAEILSEIETTLALLEPPQEIKTRAEPAPALTMEKMGELLISDDMEKMGELLISDNMENEAEAANVLPASLQEEREASLRHLYRLYRSYFGKQPSKGIADLETRYRSVMGTLDQLQSLAELRRDVTASDLTINGLLVRVRGFVTALYCMFHEFAALLARIVDGQSIDIDTEAMALSQESPLEMSPQLVHDITPLMHVYNKQHQFQQHKGSLYESGRDATAFLIFLQECLEQTFARRQEVVAQIKSTANLLNELLILLTDYELAVAHIMQSPSKSR